MKYALLNGVILDGNEDMQPVKGKCILIGGEKIVDIVDEGQPVTGYQVVDLKGQYVLPGLINLHVHLPSSGRPKNKDSDPKKTVKLMTSNALCRMLVRKLCTNFAKTQLYSGVTTIRTVGGVLDVDTKIRDRIESGKEVGPRILAANMAVSVEGGHMAGSVAYAAHSKEEAVFLVHKIASEKPDLIKLMITGGVLDAKVKGEPGVLKMPAEYVKAACDVAHSYGLPVAAHVESTAGVEVALENGVDTIEHGATPTEHIIELFKEKKAAHITTLSPALPYALFDRSISHASEMEQYNGNVVFEGIIDCAKACLANDIPVGLGTDTGCPYITHYDMWRELNYFHKYCDVSNAFAIYTATKRNAQIAHIDDLVGTIEKGKVADLIVVKDNPLDNLTALRTVNTVFVRGKRIENPQVKKMDVVETELDKFL